MELKIGEIKQVNGEWYQCVEGTGCYKCDFNIDESTCIADNPHCTCRSDKKDVVFKKLEKVGEPYEYFMQGTGIILVQEYILASQSYICGDEVIDCQKDGRVAIEIKEDMEENKTSLPKEYNPLTRIVYAYVNGKISDNELIKSIKEMSDEYPYNKNKIKPFSLEAAKLGKPVCTRDGRKARIICFDAKDTQPIIGLYEKNIDGIVREYLCSYHTDGRMYDDQDTGYDLMMLPEKKEGWVNVYKERCYESKEEAIRHIAPGTHYIDTIRVEWEDKE